MFFDADRTDEKYHDLLIAAAGAQRRAFVQAFDWERRVPRPQAVPERGLFKRKPVIAARERALQDMREAQLRLREHREKEGIRLGTAWWAIPWEQTERWLRYDLGNAAEDGSWRYESRLSAVGRDGAYRLYMLQEGHMTDFCGTRSHSFGIESPYTDEERRGMVRKYNRDLTWCALMDVSYDLDRPVHSVLTGADYGTKADYYLSDEYFATRLYLSDSYHRTLYTEKETYGVEAVSCSRHYRCLYAIADFHVRPDGLLDHMALKPFEVIRAEGDVPGDLKERNMKRDPAVVCAGYLADMPEVRFVPMRLFGKETSDSAGSFEEAMRQAEIFTCLADKIQ